MACHPHLFFPTEASGKELPLRHTFFIICVEGPSLLRAAEERGMLTGYRVGKGSSVSHILLADDSLLFAKANPQQPNIFSEILLTYEKHSGIDYQF